MHMIRLADSRADGNAGSSNAIKTNTISGTNNNPGRAGRSSGLR